MRALAWTAIGAAGLLLAAGRARAAQVEAEPAAPVALGDGSMEAGQDTGPGFDVDAFMATFDPGRFLEPAPADDIAAANRSAFLDMIAVSEGTADPNGYAALFGHRASRPHLFIGFADHPRAAQQFTDAEGRRLWTTAAGRYQFMAIAPLPSGGTTRVDTWDRISRKLGLADFSPAAQDAAAWELITEKGAAGDVEAGRFDDAVAKVRGVWASLPGAGYGQPEQSLERLRLAFVRAGGTLA